MAKWQRAWIGLVVSTMVIGAAASAAEPVPSLPRADIEAVVRDLLLREPELVYRALEELQRRRDVAETQARATKLAAHRSELVADPADPSLGAAESDVVLVEFFDYRCGYCRSMAGGLRQLVEQDGGLRLVMKELPILGEESVTASKAALAAQAQGRYADMHWALWQANDFSAGGILALARSLGLDPEKFVADMESPAVQATIDRNLGLARALGINGTPSFVIGTTLFPGAVPLAELRQQVEAERARGG